MSPAGAPAARIRNVGTATMAHLAADGIARTSSARPAPGPLPCLTILLHVIVSCSLFSLAFLYDGLGNSVLEREILIKIRGLKKYGINLGVVSNEGIEVFM